MNDKNFNSPKDKEFLKKEVESSKKESLDGDIIPIDFSVIEKLEGEDLESIRDPDTLMKSINNITSTYEKFGEEYGIDIKYDIHSVSSTFKSILSRNSEEVFKVYLAKAFTKVRLSVFNKILISISLLVDRITQKDILESDNVDLSVGLVEKLIELMDKLNTIYEQVEIKSADTVLRKVSKDIAIQNEGNKNELSPESVMRLLKDIKSSK
jgi:hypothetical protein